MYEDEFSVKINTIMAHYYILKYIRHVRRCFVKLPQQQKQFFFKFITSLKQDVHIQNLFNVMLVKLFNFTHFKFECYGKINPLQKENQ